jgi:hypothetical protein
MSQLRTNSIVPAGGIPAGASGGGIIQIVDASTTTATSTTSTIPFDSTIPQNTEGTELLTVSITPRSTSNKLIIFVSVPFIDGSSNILITFPLFRDSGANAIALGQCEVSGADNAESVFYTHFISPNTSSSTTFKLRYGPSAGTAFINRRNSGETLGATAAVRLTVMEVSG